MSFQKVEIETFSLKPFEAIGKQWTLISAAKGGVVNTMTASWGGLGVLWGKNVVTVYIRPQRYTRDFVDAGEYFTVTLFDGHKGALNVLGSKSGRDGDKIAEVGFHVETVEGQPTFAEGKTVLVCRKLYRDQIRRDKFMDPALCRAMYPKIDYHFVYIAEVTAIYENEG